ncbi:MAG: MBL fold metallo-hydrolase [Patescibacteria group bacterium]|nr:MAG: MBL fold metallo-hydrolase [Patescibacteria group bacterium]
MEIRYLGHSSFLIKNKNIKIVTDPFDPKMVGLPYKKQGANLITTSHNHQDHCYTEKENSAELVIGLPGEYEINTVSITGYPTFHDNNNGLERGKNTIFRFLIDNKTILHCGDLGHILNDELIDEIGNIDIALVPVGGFYTIGPQEAIKVINQIEPKVVVPMHYKTDKHNDKVFANLKTLNEFLTEFGLNPETVDHLNKLTDNDFTDDDEKKVVVLKPIYE